MSAGEIHVAQVGPDPAGRGGMAAVTRDLLDSSLAERHSLEAIVTWRGFQPAARLRDFGAALVALARWCRGPGRRVAHIHTAARGSLYRKSVCVFLVRLLRRPVVLQIHAGPGDIAAFAERLGPIRRLFIRRGLKAASRVLAVSAESARAIEARFGVGDVGVIPNAAPSVPAELAGELPGVAAVLYLGGFANPVKGGGELLAALAGGAADIAGACFELAGPGDAPPQLLELTRRAPNVRWSGWLDEDAKREALSRSSLFVLPAVSEGLPVALLEAMAWGRAIVATAVGGIPDVVEDGVDAIVVPPGDPDALAAAIGRLAAAPEERRRLGAAARRRAESLNEDEVCSRLDALYRELAG